MNKAERLFQLTSILRGRRTAVSAQYLASRTDVSVRTIYRDIQALILSGVPIEGEPGIGYLMKSGYEVPPLMFTNDELQSLLVGIRMVKAFTDAELGSSAQQAEDKIMAVLPEALKQHAEQQPYRIPVLERDDHLRQTHLTIRKACEQQRIIRFDYQDQQQNLTTRDIWPLGLIGWGDRWTLLGWCEMRKDYRNFRFDRITNLSVSDNAFSPSPNRSLQHYLKSMGQQA